MNVWLLMVNAEPTVRPFFSARVAAQEGAGGGGRVIAEARAAGQCKGLAGGIDLGADAGGGDGHGERRCRCWTAAGAARCGLVAGAEGPGVDGGGEACGHGRGGLAAWAALPARAARPALGGGRLGVAQTECLGAHDGAYIGHCGRGRGLLSGERLTAAFEALAAGGVDCQHGAYRGVELCDLSCDGLVGHQHGQGEADGNSQDGHHGGRSDLVSEGVADTPGKDAHVTPRRSQAGPSGRRMRPHWYSLLCSSPAGAMDLL